MEQEEMALSQLVSLEPQLDEELVANVLIQGTSNIRSESLIASNPEIADSLIYRSLLIDWPQSQSQLDSLELLGSSESSKTSSEWSLGEIPSNIVQAMELTQVDESGQCSEQNCVVASASSSLSEDVLSNLGSNHSLSVQSVDTLPTSCQAATCVELFDDQLDEELVVNVIIQGTSNIMSEWLIASHPEIANSLIYRSLLLDWPQSQTVHGTADKVQETLVILDPQSFSTDQPSQSVQSVDMPSQAPERRSFQKTLKKLFRQPTPGNSHQVVSVATNASGADLDQASHQEPRRPLHVRVFRSLRKSFRKAFCCLGDRRMVRE